MAAPSAADIEYQKAHINDDRRIGIAVSNVVCLGVAVVAVILRYVSRLLAFLYGLYHRLQRYRSLRAGKTHNPRNESQGLCSGKLLSSLMASLLHVIDTQMSL